MRQSTVILDADYAAVIAAQAAVLHAQAQGRQVLDGLRARLGRDEPGPVEEREVGS